MGSQGKSKAYLVDARSDESIVSEVKADIVCDNLTVDTVSW